MLRTITTAIVACAFTMSVHAQASAPQQGDAWDNVREYSIEKKNEAVAHGKKLVRETDAKIKDLERQAAKSKGEAKAAYEKSIAELKEKRAQAAAKLDEMGKASSAAWDATKQGFADAYKDLNDAYHRAVAQFKKK